MDRGDSPLPTPVRVSCTRREPVLTSGCNLWRIHWATGWSRRQGRESKGLSVTPGSELRAVLEEGVCH